MLLSEQSQLVRSYFETAGYERFRRIYQAECGGVFHRHVRDGHRQTTETVLSWLGAARGMEQISVCDAGCGTGALSIPLARAGALVHGVDFSGRMIAAARRNAQGATGGARKPRFEVEDVTNLRATYHTVACIDVLPRYPQSQAIALLGHLSQLATRRLVVSFTPKTWLDPLLLKLGNSVAKRRNAPLLHTHHRELIVNTLTAHGWEIARQTMISAPFKVYYCHLLELGKNTEKVVRSGEASRRDAEMTPLFGCPFAALWSGE
jgi:magnesium-protoporphyrin O-methyltransferase